LLDKETATLALANRRKELPTLPGKLVSLWEAHNICHPTGGYDGYVIDDPLMIQVPSGQFSSLLIRLKHESLEFRDIENWRGLLKIDTAEELIVKLAPVAHRMTLK
jgi:hypothetical protein